MKRYKYIQPEDYETAARNGICKSTLHHRVREIGWDIDRAITEPPVKRVPWTEEQRQKQKEIGLSEWTVRERMKKWGITRDEALSIPKIDSEQALEMARKKVAEEYGFFTAEERAMLEANGIKRGTAYARIRMYGWAREKAISTPPQSREQIKGHTKFNRLRREA